MRKKIEKILSEGVVLSAELASDSKAVKIIEKIAKCMIGSVKRGGKIIVFGDGGSAADSQHLACELVGRFKKNSLRVNSERSKRKYSNRRSPSWPCQQC